MIDHAIDPHHLILPIRRQRVLDDKRFGEFGGNETKLPPLLHFAALLPQQGNKIGKKRRTGIS
jgi:hypothetical protein